MHQYYTKEQQNNRREKVCRDFYHQVIHLKSYCPRLDHVFSQIVICNFQLGDRTQWQEIPGITYHLLSRLPGTPLALPDPVPAALSRDHYIGNTSEEGISAASSNLWRQLQVTSYVSANTIRSALLVAVYGGTACHMLSDLVDTIADLLTVASTLSSSADSEFSKQRWFIVRAFLWTSWQRCSMIYLYCVLGHYLKTGFNDEGGPSLIRRGMLPSPGLSIQEMSRRNASSEKPDYMCGWAFELLRSDPVCLGLDFRRFYRRYALAFGHRPGRCIRGERASCIGNDSDKCQRFKGMHIENQSAHNSGCKGDCGRLTWDEKSYRSVSGARAVSFGKSSRGTLIYCQASGDTLAVSHVWSHGQGGRPEVGYGINDCLHRRYVSLAKSLGCDSYWMDTPCIPNDHVLRDEAIQNINSVFENSKATLVCDRDLMDINVADLSVKVRELLVVTAIVCDWNLRAWTFLEAFRGRDSIYLLCKDNAIVPLKETVDIVHRDGSIDIALLLLTIPHLLPPSVRKDYTNVSFPTHVMAFLSVETSGSLLSHRAASRPGDDIVIWSLLLKDDVYKNAEAFWKSRTSIEGRGLHTSFLISSAPRLKTRGLRWAPSSPTAQLRQYRSDSSKRRFLAFDGYESEMGRITKDGFEASWFLYDFVGPCMCAKRLSSILDIDVDHEDQACHTNLQIIRRRYLRGYLWGALLRPLDASSSRNPAPNRGDSSKIMVAVCATNLRTCWTWGDKFGIGDDKIRWTWRGVYEWDMAEPLPKFRRTSEVILS